jgi:hypothetical protein
LLFVDSPVFCARCPCPGCSLANQRAAKARGRSLCASDEDFLSDPAVCP